MTTSESSQERYRRHILLKEFGESGQEKLTKANVLMIGAGGLGSPALLYLSAAGVGHIGIADHDCVDISNLQRQIIHRTEDIDQLKVESASRTIEALNPEVNLRLIREKVTKDNILELVEDYDFIIDGTDNYLSKFLINDACVFAKKPYVHSGVLRFHGQIITVIPGKTACYRCIFPSPPPPGSIPTCSAAGVLGTVPGIMGTMQATECIKYLTGIGTLLTDRLLALDSLNMTTNEIAIRKSDECPVCGQNPTINKLSEGL